MAEVGLKRPRVCSFVGQHIASRVPEHVWMNFEVDFGFNARPFHQARKSGCREWCTTVQIRIQKVTWRAV